MSANLPALAESLMKLPPDQRLIVAAELYRRGKTDLAETIAQSAVDQMTAKRLFTKAQP